MVGGLVVIAIAAVLWRGWREPAQRGVAHTNALALDATLPSDDAGIEHKAERVEAWLEALEPDQLDTATLDRLMDVLDGREREHVAGLNRQVELTDAEGTAIRDALATSHACRRETFRRIFIARAGVSAGHAEAMECLEAFELAIFDALGASRATEYRERFYDGDPKQHAPAP